MTKHSLTRSEIDRNRNLCLGNASPAVFKMIFGTLECKIYIFQFWILMLFKLMNISFCILLLKDLLDWENLMWMVSSLTCGTLILCMHLLITYLGKWIQLNLVPFQIMMQKDESRNLFIYLYFTSALYDHRR